VDALWFVALVVVALSRPTMPIAIAAAVSCFVPAALTLCLIYRVEHAPIVEFSNIDDEDL
jgi:hypothetical protein